MHVPGLQVYLQYDMSPPQGSWFEEPIPHASGKSLHIEVEYLSPSSQCSENDRAQVVDVEKSSWVETPAPEGVLFSTQSLLLKRRSTWLRLCARLA